MKRIIICFFCVLFSVEVLFCQQNNGVGNEAFERAGLTNIKHLDKNIVVELKYATADNFMHTNVYGNLREAYLQPDAAQKLAKAQKLLKAKHHEYNLIVYDAARPRSIQQKMWNVVRNTPNKKYVTSPARVSMHSYGVAVDISIVDQNGKPLDMGTHFDEFDEKSQPRNEQKFLQLKQLTRQQINNRLLLRSIMRQAGFHSIQNEWWHFQAELRADAQKKYKPID